MKHYRSEFIRLGKLISVSKFHRQSGGILVLISFMFVALVGVAALAVDLGSTWYESKEIQTGADSGALAAVAKVQQGSVSPDSAVDYEVRSLLQANLVSDTTELLIKQCGHWFPEAKIFTPCAAPCTGCGYAGDVTNINDPNSVNAVRVTTKRRVKTFLANLIGVAALSPQKESIAMTIFANSQPCIRPFGVEDVPNGPLDGVQVGDEFTVGTTGGHGNWGKIDIGGNMSSGNNFRDAMMYGACDDDVQPGRTVTPGSGFGGPISTAFANAQSAGSADEMTFAVTTRFPNGNSGTVDILEFIKVKYVRDNERNGAQWEGTFKLLARPATPPIGGGSGVPIRRYLVE